MCSLFIRVAVSTNRLLRHIIIGLFNIKLTNLFIIEPIYLKINLSFLIWSNAGLDELTGLVGPVHELSHSLSLQGSLRCSFGAR